MACMLSTLPTEQSLQPTGPHLTQIFFSLETWEMFGLLLVSPVASDDVMGLDTQGFLLTVF